MNYIVTGLGFGDEGKGSVIDALCRHFEIKLVVRHNGGGQAAHNVVLPSGVHHTFAQFGSNSFIPGAKTFLSKYTMVNPVTFINEANVLKTKIELPQVYIDRNCLVTTPWHMKLNVIREKDRGNSHHGTTGMGISETVMDSLARYECLRIEDLLSRSLSIKLLETRDFLREDVIKLGAKEEFDTVDFKEVLHSFNEFVKMDNVHFLRPFEVKELLQKEKDIAFEGAQGVLLDQDFGFHPHTTWSKTTPENAKALCEENQLGESKVIGVTRTYHTRHGAGPFPTESREMNFPEPHNGDDYAPGKFRQGYLDMSLLKYAIKCCNGIDLLAVNHVDCNTEYLIEDNSIHLEIPTCIEDQECNCENAWNPSLFKMQKCTDVLEYLIKELNISFFIRGNGPSYKDKHFIT